MPDCLFGWMELDQNSELGTVMDDLLTRLAATIRSRRGEPSTQSYTASLLERGTNQCAKKLGEEAVETVIAALSEDDAALAEEAADLLYHLLVLLESREIAWETVLQSLEGRMGTSGLQEKAARSTS